jgi:hypothetical protein
MRTTVDASRLGHGARYGLGLEVLRLGCGVELWGHGGSLERSAARPAPRPVPLTCPQLEPQVIAAVDHGGRLDDLEVVGVQAVSQPQQRRQAPDKRSVVVIEGHVLGMAVGWQGLAVVAGDVGDQVAFSGAEAVQVGVADQIQRVLVVGRLGYGVADVMEQAGHLQQPALGRAEPMERARLVEQGQREGGDLAGVGSSQVCRRAKSSTDRRRRGLSGGASDGQGSRRASSVRITLRSAQGASTSWWSPNACMTRAAIWEPATTLRARSSSRPARRLRWRAVVAAR